MPLYYVTGTVTVSAYTIVKAASEEEAHKIAGGRDGAIARARGRETT